VLMATLSLTIGYNVRLHNMNSARLACNWCMGIYGKISCRDGSLYSQVLILTDMHSFDMAVCNYIKMYLIGVGTI